MPLYTDGTPWSKRAACSAARWHASHWLSALVDAAQAHDPKQHFAVAVVTSAVKGGQASSPSAIVHVDSLLVLLHLKASYWPHSAHSSAIRCAIDITEPSPVSSASGGRVLTARCRRPQPDGVPFGICAFVAFTPQLECLTYCPYHLQCCCCCRHSCLYSQVWAITASNPNESSWGYYCECCSTFRLGTVIPSGFTNRMTRM